MFCSCLLFLECLLTETFVVELAEEVEDDDGEFWKIDDKLI